MPFIEKNEDNEKYIKNMYDMDIVLFEHCILTSKQIRYSIMYTPRKDIYDVVVEDIVNSKLLNYEARHKLSGSTLKYFNLIKDEEYDDNFGNKFKCVSHYIEFKL